MNIWLSKKFVCVGSHRICQSLKKRLVLIGRNKCSKNTIAVHRNTSMTSWIYACEPKSKQQSTVWLLQDKPNPTIVARARSNSKQMIACFFRKNWTCRNRTTRTTQNSQSWVVHNYLFASCVPRNRENQPPKTDHYSQRQFELSQSAQTTAFLSTQNIDLMSYPPYSLELAPNDLFLFPYVKNKMRGQRFSTSEKPVDAFRMHILEIPQSESEKCCDNWFKRLQKCRDLNVEYFEKQ